MVPLPAAGFSPSPPKLTKGATSSALGLVQAVRKAPPLGVHALLGPVGMSGLPSDAIPELLLFTQLDEHTKAARVEDRVPFKNATMTTIEQQRRSSLQAGSF